MSCLLSTTGHLQAYLAVLCQDDELVLVTDPGCGAVVANHLDRYLVREKVTVADQTAETALLTLQGSAAGRFAIATELELPSPFSHCDGSIGGIPFTAMLNDRFESGGGLDILCADTDAATLLDEAGNIVEITFLDPDTVNVLRVEAGRPAWGAELDGSVIPLEANLADAISFDKGCYLGQEIIARIHSRGHTNRSLIGLRSDIEMCSGDRLLALNGDREGQDVGWITSSANSPRYGWIGLGYLRNDCLQDGAMFAGANGARIASAMLPIHFTSGA